MAKICPVTQKSSKVAGGYSNRVRATKFNPTGNVRKHANLQKKRIFIPELNRTVTVTLSTKGFRTLVKTAHTKRSRRLGLYNHPFQFTPDIETGALYLSTYNNLVGKSYFI